jgi:3-oxoacyl-[acyl-carrier protein] reductase
LEVEPEVGNEIEERGGQSAAVGLDRDRRSLSLNSGKTMNRRVALVTGSATGIGRAAAWRFAERGYAVVVNYSRSSAEAEETADGVRTRGSDVRVVQANVGDDSAVRQLVAETVDGFGGLDVLVNNAATTHFVPHQNLDALTETVWDEILQVNLKGTFYACRASMPLLKERRGSIVNVASVAGIAGSGSSIAYAASKGAVITLTKSLARAFAPEVRVNAVAPGPVQTRWLADHQDMVEQAMAQTPLKRPAYPDDIADAVVFLADVSSLMTGQVVVIDGGRTI